MSKKLISFVIPVYNEEDNVEVCHTALSEVANRWSQQYEFEFVFTDNHSEDRTFELLAGLSRKDPRVRVFRFSKNFGYQRSIYHGFMRSRGAALIQFDCDLQDPPALIDQFVREWENGSKVVYGVRTKREESFLDTGLRKVFYWFVNRLSRERLPKDAGDFRLMDRVIIDELRKVCDSKIYLRGRIAEMGFKQTGIPYARAARTRGYSKFNFSRNLGLAIDALLSHTNLPLRFSIYFGLFIFFLSGLGGIAYLVAYFALGREWPPGFTTLVLFMLFQLGLTSMFLGVLGEYVARIYDHLKVPQDVILEQIIDPKG